MGTIAGGSLDLRAEVSCYIGHSMVSEGDLRRAATQELAPKISRVAAVMGSPEGGCKRLRVREVSFYCRGASGAIDELVWALGGTGDLVLLAVRRGIYWEVNWYEPGNWEMSLNVAYGCLKERAAVG